jgi:hypothetical protein
LRGDYAHLASANTTLQNSRRTLFLDRTPMNIKNFSLDWIQPNPATQQTSSVDPWMEAVNYYKPRVLEILQVEGATKVQDLFDKTKIALGVPDLKLEQFVGVIDRMILNKQLAVKKRTESPGDATVALPVPN